jgi:CubicO group peptidase (beta-lactamase class C family)
MIAPKVDSSVSFAAGGIYTTVGDLNKWAVAMLHNQLITKADWQIATTINQENYGYGWMIGDNYGRVSIGHNGGVHGFIANLFMTPDDASVIVLLSNDMGNDLSAIRRTISAIINDKEYQLPAGHREIKMATKQLQEYVGNYELAPGFGMKVFMDGNSLMGQLPGQNAFQLYPAAQNEFFLKVADAELRFLRNKNNKVERVLLKQNGRAIPGVKK